MTETFRRRVYGYARTVVCTRKVERMKSDLPSEAAIRYALRCAANWLGERAGTGYMDLPDERGEILRWARDNLDETE